MADLTREFIDGVWTVAHDRTSLEQPSIPFARLVERVQQRFPGASPGAVQAALEELVERGQIDDSEGYGPTSEIKVLRRYP